MIDRVKHVFVLSSDLSHSFHHIPETKQNMHDIIKQLFLYDSILSGNKMLLFIQFGHCIYSSMVNCAQFVYVKQESASELRSYFKKIPVLHLFQLQNFQQNFLRTKYVEYIIQII